MALNKLLLNNGSQEIPEARKNFCIMIADGEVQIGGLTDGALAGATGTDIVLCLSVWEKILPPGTEVKITTLCG